MKGRRKTSRRHSSRPFHGKARRREGRRAGARVRRRAMWRRVVVLLLIVVTTFLLLWLGSYLYDYQIEFYEPRDLDRG